MIVTTSWISSFIASLGTMFCWLLHNSWIYPLHLRHTLIYHREEVNTENSTIYSIVLLDYGELLFHSDVDISRKCVVSHSYSEVSGRLSVCLEDGTISVELELVRTIFRAEDGKISTESSHLQWIYQAQAKQDSNPKWMPPVWKTCPRLMTNRERSLKKI